MVTKKIGSGCLTTNDYLSQLRKTNRRNIVTLYLDYRNNFLTVSYFAEYYSMSTKKANRVINLGRYILLIQNN